MGKRPNILLITSDQQRGDCLGCEGRGVKTPHIDLLAEQGTRFSACITPNNVCQPTRASILTGLLPRTHGVADNGLDLPPATGEQGFAGQLSQSRLPQRADRQAAFRHLAHLRAHRHARVPGLDAPLRRGLVRALHGLRPCRADDRGPQPVAAGAAALGPALRALVLSGRAGRPEERAVQDQCRAGHARRAADLAFRPAGRLAQLELGRRPDDGLSAGP